MTRPTVYDDLPLLRAVAQLVVERRISERRARHLVARMHHLIRPGTPSTTAERLKGKYRELRALLEGEARKRAASGGRWAVIQHPPETSRAARLREHAAALSRLADRIETAPSAEALRRAERVLDVLHKELAGE